MEAVARHKLSNVITETGKMFSILLFKLVKKRLQCVINLKNVNFM